MLQQVGLTFTETSYARQVRLCLDARAFQHTFIQREIIYDQPVSVQFKIDTDSAVYHHSDNS